MLYGLLKYLNTMPTLLAVIALIIAMPVKANSKDPVRLLEAIFAKPASQIDLARTKLEIDQLIDPTINIEQSLKHINSMVSVVNSATTPNSTAIDRLQSLRTYLYDTGYWNDNKPFRYDFDDPMGTRISNKLLPTYLKLRKGNCFSMPFLFVIMAQKLNLNTTISTAPLHVFAKYKDPDSGKWYSLETTNIAEFVDDKFYQRQNPMTKAAINNGVYLQPLSKKETVAVMAVVVSEYYAQQQQWQRSIDVANVILKHYPKYVYAMLKVGNAYSRLLQEKIRFARAKGTVTPIEKTAMDHLYAQNLAWFEKAEKLGWQPPPKSAETQYLNNVRKRTNSTQ